MKDWSTGARRFAVTARGLLVPLALLGPALLGLAACASSPTALPGPATTANVPEMGQQDFAAMLESDYPLRPGDKISVNVYREADLSVQEVTLAADGRISLPLLGSQLVAGMTPSAIEDYLEEQLRQSYLRDPQIAVNVVDYGSHMVTVEGDVQKPGLFQFQPGTRLSGGISLAEGPDRTADLADVVVFRQTPDGMQVAKFDLAAVRMGTMLDPMLQPGDRIVIGTDGMSQFWQDFIQALPLFALFTNVRF